MKNTFVTLIAAFAVSGCAVGNKHAYHNLTAQTSARTEKSVAVATLDQREYILSRQSRQELVGMQRGGFGNPFDVLTESGRPLASEFTHAIRAALERNGIKVFAIETKPSNSTQAAMAELVASAGERLLLLSVKEWIGDSQVNTEARYDLQLVVTDKSGKTLATNEYEGSRDLGGSFFNPPGHAKKVMPKAFKEAVEHLLNSPAIAAALR
jgi:hypothetical protein